MKLSSKGIKFLNTNEDFKQESYLDGGGVWTIGWGTTRINGQPVTPGMWINQLVGDALFNGDVSSIITTIERVVKVPINQNQVDALTSFAYNIGLGGFTTSSLLVAINAKLIINEDLFTRWNKIKGVISQGLINRRKREYNLFMSKEGL